MLVGTDPFATTKPDRRLIKLLIRAHRFNAALAGSDGVPFAALAKQEGVSPSYFTRLVRLSYLAPDITRAILDGRQPHGLTADKLLVQSRLPLGPDEAQWLTVVDKGADGQTSVRKLIQVRFSRLETVV